MQEHDSGRFIEQLCTRQSGNQTPHLESADLDSEKCQELLLRQLSDLYCPRGVGCIKEKEEK